MLERPEEWVFTIAGLVLMAGSVLVGATAVLTWWSALAGDNPGALVAGTLLVAVAVACGAAGWLMVRTGFGVTEGSRVTARSAAKS